MCLSFVLSMVYYVQRLWFKVSLIPKPDVCLTIVCHDTSFFKKIIKFSYISGRKCRHIKRILKYFDSKGCKSFLRFMRNIQTIKLNSNFEQRIKIFLNSQRSLAAFMMNKPFFYKKASIPISSFKTLVEFFGKFSFKLCFYESSVLVFLIYTNYSMLI